MCENHTELLQQIFENVNTWLHFAEAKNAAIIALNIALLAALVSSDLYVVSIVLFSWIAVGLLLSTIFSLLSFKPNHKRIAKITSKGIDFNLLHFAYIASLETDEYLEKLNKYYWKNQCQDCFEFSQIDRDYSDEIIQNSRITIQKQLYFKYTLYIDFAMIVLMCVLIICA